MQEERLNQLIPTYAEDKNKLDAYKKACEEENNEIKQLLKELELDEWQAGEYSVKYIVQHRETMNEEKVMAILRKYDIPGIIKTRSYVDFEALESAIYLDRVPEVAVAEMQAAKEVKLVETLKLSKKKTKK